VCSARLHGPQVRGEFGELYDFCGRTHARLAAARGLEPPPTALGDPAHFSRTFSGRPPSHGCAVCSRSAGSSSGGVPVCQACEEPYTISTLTTAHPKYVRVRAQFLDSWDSSASGPRPTVERVLQVRNPSSIFDRYEAYKRLLQAAGRPVNEERRFHATGMAAACAFGIDQSQPPCDDECLHRGALTQGSPRPPRLGHLGSATSARPPSSPQS